MTISFTADPSLFASPRLAMLAVMVAITLIVYYRVGIAALRRYWINFDLLWAVALVGAGGIAMTGLLVAPAH